MTASMPYRGENRRLSIGEEVLNAVTHGLGALLGVVGTIILICHARAIGGRLNLVSVTVFGVSMILLYLISCLYHALPRSRGKAVFQVLDHCSIFLLIVGTYTPICLRADALWHQPDLRHRRDRPERHRPQTLEEALPGAVHRHGLDRYSGFADHLEEHASARACFSGAGGRGLHRGRDLLPAEGKALSPRHLALLRAGRHDTTLFHGLSQLLRIKQTVGQNKEPKRHERLRHHDGFQL